MPAFSSSRSAAVTIGSSCPKSGDWVVISAATMTCCSVTTACALYPWMFGCPWVRISREMGVSHIDLALGHQRRRERLCGLPEPPAVTAPPRLALVLIGRSAATRRSSRGTDGAAASRPDSSDPTRHLSPLRSSGTITSGRPRSWHSASPPAPPECCAGLSWRAAGQLTLGRPDVAA
jgi:hypothetical protein